MLIKPDYRMCEKEARHILATYSGDSLPVDVVGIARDMGLAVKRCRFKKESSISGFFDFEENAIYVNGGEHYFRQRFTIAHELGHYVMHKDFIKSDDYNILYRSDIFNIPDDPREKEANVFARNLLVPPKELALYKNDATLDELSILFNVSIPVLKIQLNRNSF